jgi:hypothetical protein
MNRQDAFAQQGVPNINRKQWHAAASDGLQVLSVWEENIKANRAEAHVHQNAYHIFEPGMSVRIVVQRGERDPETQNMKTLEAYPDTLTWTVLTKEERAIDHPSRRFLHVVTIQRAEGRDR